MKRKIGLVIQGPLVSIGRTGVNMHDTPQDLIKRNSITHFDCRENIRKIISEFGHLFDEIVVSTWENEVKPGDEFKGAKLIAAPDPGGIIQGNHYKDNNKHRQFISTLNGLFELEKSGIEYAVKMRTDMYLDLNRLLDSFFEDFEKRNKPQAIYSTVVHLPTFMLHDIYFVAKLNVLKEFCEAIISHDKFEFIPSVHREIVLKPAYVIYKKEINVPDWAYFPKWPPDGVCQETRTIFEYMFKNVFFSLDPEIFRATLWRGTYFEREHVSSLVEKWQRTRKYNLPALITIDWQRYFHFLKETKGRKISLYDKNVIYIGNLGWKIWNFARKVARKFVLG